MHAFQKGHSVLILILHRSCSVWIKSTNRFTTVLTDGPDNRSVLGKDRQLWSLSNLPSDLSEWLDILLVWLACDDSGFYHRWAGLEVCVQQQCLSVRRYNEAPTRQLQFQVRHPSRSMGVCWWFYIGCDWGKIKKFMLRNLDTLQLQYPPYYSW